jgi:hypothetical protein
MSASRRLHPRQRCPTCVVHPLILWRLSHELSIWVLREPGGENVLRRHTKVHSSWRTPICGAEAGRNVDKSYACCMVHLSFFPAYRIFPHGAQGLGNQLCMHIQHVTLRGTGSRLNGCRLVPISTHSHQYLPTLANIYPLMPISDGLTPISEGFMPISTHPRQYLMV